MIVTDYEIVRAMHRYGGSFIRAIADAFDRADSDNYAKLKAAFPEYWTEYTGIAIHVHNSINESREVTLPSAEGATHE